MLDYLRLALWLGGAAAIVMAFCIIYIAWENAGSRNLALATGTLGAALILAVIQLAFELRGTQTSDFITVEYTIDRAVPSIRLWDYTPIAASQRMVLETMASDSFMASHPGQFDGDRAKLTRDMAIFSVLGYIVTEQFDWQMRRTRYQASVATLSQSAGASKASECSKIAWTEIQRMLTDAGNAFASSPVYGQRDLCLPPQSAITVSGSSVILATPFCAISFAYEDSGSTMFYQPRSNALIRPTLPNGESSLETRIAAFRVVTQYSAIRAQHYEMPRYQNWAKGFAEGAALWFQGENRNGNR